MGELRSQLQHYPLTVPAGKKGLIKATGEFIVCKESSDIFNMRLVGRTDVIPFELGLQYKAKPGEPFTAVEVINDTANVLTVEFYIGSGEFDDFRLNTLIERQIAVGYRALPTEIKGSSTVSLAAAASVDVDELVDRRRKSIIITNTDTDGDLDILDSTGKHFATVFARTAEEFETNDTITIKNNTANTVLLNIGEIYYALL